MAGANITKGEARMEYYRYAQEYGGQKLHLVEDFGNGQVAYRALCGRNPQKRGTWRMTINVPLAHACYNCIRAFNKK